jgi:hypothetical protein
VEVDVGPWPDAAVGRALVPPRHVRHGEAEEPIEASARVDEEIGQSITLFAAEAR